MNEWNKEITEAIAARAVAEVRAFRVKSGDTLHVRVGIEDMGDGQPPWIPGPDELDQIKEELEQYVPEGVKAYVTHFGVYIDSQFGPSD